jgi:hypothetical protein
MKRILLTLIAASGLALLASAPAGAVNNALCGHSYAILLQGAAPNHTNQTGTGDNPGALTAAAGAGVVTFGTATGTTCASVSGEVIFNEGDIQTGSTFIGPNHCYDGASLFTTGLPCFDGTDHLTGSTLTNPGANGIGSEDLHLAIGYQWINHTAASGMVPIDFTIEVNTGASIITGSSKPVGVGGSTDSPVLTLTGQKIGVVPVATTYGALPYLGNLTVSCSAYGANGTDLVAAGQGNGLDGGFGSVIGAVEIFSNGDSGGAVSFNSNNNATASGFTGTTPDNTDCSIQTFPGSTDPDYADNGVIDGQFADGTSNSVATVDNSTNPCTDQFTAGAGYTNSAVAWGSTDTASYLTTTGVTSAGTGFVPPGTIGTCTTYGQAPAGFVHTSNTAATSLLASNTTVTKNISVTNTSPADCHVAITMAPATASSQGQTCSVSVSPSVNDVPGDSVLAVAATISCTCSGEQSEAITTVCAGGTDNNNNCSATTKQCVGGTNNGGACTSNTACTGGGVCTPDSTVCTNGGGTCVAEVDPSATSSIQVTAAPSYPTSGGCLISVGGGSEPVTCTMP